MICDSYVRPCTLVRICDECNYGSYQGRCVICGGPGVSDAYYCKECTIMEKDVRGLIKLPSFFIRCMLLVWGLGVLMVVRATACYGLQWVVPVNVAEYRVCSFCLLSQGIIVHQRLENKLSVADHLMTRLLGPPLGAPRDRFANSAFILCSNYNYCLIRCGDI